MLQIFHCCYKMQIFSFQEEEIEIDAPLHSKDKIEEEFIFEASNRYMYMCGLGTWLTLDS